MIRKKYLIIFIGSKLTRSRIPFNILLKVTDVYFGVFLNTSGLGWDPNKPIQKSNLDNKS